MGFGRYSNFDLVLTLVDMYKVCEHDACVATVCLCVHAGTCISICAAYTLVSSLVAYVTFTTAVSVSVFTVKQERETKKQNHEVQITKAQTHVAGLCCCRRWVGHASRFPWWPEEPLVCVNPLQPPLHWLPSRSCCCLYTQELLSTIASPPLAQ